MKKDAGFFQRGKMLTAVLLVVLLLTSCTSSASSIVASSQATVQDVSQVPATLPQDILPTYQLLCSLPAMNSQLLTELARGVQDRCDELGINVNMHNAHDDLFLQAAEVDAFVKAGGQVVLCSPVDAQGMAPFLEVAQQQGAHVLGVGEGVAAEVAITFDYRMAGGLVAERAAAWAAEQRTPPAAVLLTSGALPSSYTAGLTSAYNTALPQAEITHHVLSGLVDEAVAALLEEDSSIRVFLADTDVVALAARDAVIAYLAQTQEVPVEEVELEGYFFGGYSATQEGLTALENNNLQVTVNENGYMAGIALVDMAAKLMENAPVEGRVIEPILVDKANAAEYNV